MTGITIRRMTADDEASINAALRAMGWQERPGLYRSYVAEEEQGLRLTFVAERGGAALGYVTLILRPESGPFAGRGWPEVADFNVFEPYRRQGVGSALMDAAESAAAAYADTVTIGVGLHAGYGAAQRMYVRRGYIPDGSGVWYKDRVCKPYETACANDDDLVLYLSKRLRD